MKLAAVLTLTIASLIPTLRAETETPKAAATAPAAAKLVVGSPAPEFKPVKWLQGTPVESFEADKTYVMEFWATWCGPCVAGIPHLNELHNKFKDKGLVIVGVNVWETTPDKTEQFVKGKGEGMSYRIAYDGEKTGHTAINWLKPAGVNGIPHAIVVRDSKILWKGHPGQLSEEMVGEMVAGKFDAAKAAAKAEVEEAMQAEFGKAMGKFRSALVEKKFDEAETNLKQVIELASKAGYPADRVVFMEKSSRVDIAVGRGDSAKAVELIKEFAPAEATGRDAGAKYFAAAQKMITTPGLRDRDFQFALNCLEKFRAADAAFAKDSYTLVYFARAQEGLGKKDEALKSLEEASSGKVAASLIKEIDAAKEALKAGKPWPKGMLNRDAE